MPDVFVSYSRRDQEFVHRLVEEVEARGKEVWRDTDDIPPATAWRDEIRRGIDGSHVFAFVLSPDAVTSTHCAEELAYAVDSQKLVVPLVWRDIDDTSVPPALARLNYIHARAEDELTTALDQLVATIDGLPAWERTHTRLLTRAGDWEGSGRDRSLLLRGRELREAEQWSTERTEKQQPTQLELGYLLASRRASTSRLRILTGVAVVALAVTATLAAVALHQRDTAIAQKRLVSSVSLLTGASSQSDTHVDRSLLLSLEAVAAFKHGGAPSAQAKDSMISALETIRTTRAEAILHDGSDILWSIAVSRDGRLLAAASENGTVRLWDLRARRRLAALTGPEHALHSVAVSPGGRLVAGGADNGVLWLWDVRTGEVVATLHAGAASINGLDFSSDGRLLVSTDANGSARLWDVLRFKPLGQLLGPRAVIRAVRFGADGRTVTGCSSDGTIWSWDGVTRHPRRVLQILGQPVDNAAFSRDGRLLAMGSERTVQLWNVRTGAPLGGTLTGPADTINSVAFSRDARTVAAAGIAGGVWLWDVDTRAQRAELPAFAGHLQSVVFTEGSTVAAAAWNGEVLVWDTRRQPSLGGPLYRQPGAVTSVAFSPDGDTLASADETGTIRLWNPRTDQPRASVRGGSGPVFIAFSPTADVLASDDATGALRLRSSRTGATIGQPLCQAGAARALAFSPDGHDLAVANADGSVQICDLRTRTQSARFDSRAGPIEAVAISPDGHILATANKDHTVRLWDLRTGDALGPLRGHTEVVRSVAFSPDSATLASGSDDGTLRLWDLRHQQQIAVLRRSGPIDSVAFSPDGQVVASAGADGNVRLWDVHYHVQLGQPLQPLKPLAEPSTAVTDQIRAVAFDPDPRRPSLATGDHAGVVRLWRGILWRGFHNLQCQVSSLVIGNLTRAEWKELTPALPFPSPSHNTCPRTD